MTPARPVHLLEALRWRGFLVSWWPWRATVYLATTVPIAGMVSLGLLFVGAPLLAAVNSAQRQGRPLDPRLVAFVGVGAFVLLMSAPVVSAAVAVVERWRLGIVDERALPTQRWRGLAARYTTAAAWREVA